MPIIMQYFLVIGIFQGLLLSCLLNIGSHISSASRLLGVWCFFLSISFLGVFITLDKEINAFSILIGWSHFLPASFGTFLYLYCKLAITNQSFIRRYIIYFIPVFVCYLLNLNILFESPENKLHLILNGPPNTLNFQISQSILFIQPFVFIWLSISLVRKYQTHAQGHLANFNPEIFNWLKILLILNFIIWSLKVLSGVSKEVYFLSFVADVLIILLILSIAMAHWHNPKLFLIEGISREVEVPDDSKEAVAALKNDGNLNKEIRIAILYSVKQEMQEKKLYRDTRLNLTNLADIVDVSSHHLSEALNKQAGKNFYQFVNEYRIKEVCHRLEDDPTKKILDIALDAGFSSKSTFNTVFKELVGCTPRQYRQKVLVI